MISNSQTLLALVVTSANDDEAAEQIETYLLAFI